MEQHEIAVGKVYAGGKPPEADRRVDAIKRVRGFVKERVFFTMLYAGGSCKGDTSREQFAKWAEHERSAEAAR